MVTGYSYEKLNPASLNSFYYTENEYGNGLYEDSLCVCHILEIGDFSNIQMIKAFKTLYYHSELF